MRVRGSTARAAARAARAACALAAIMLAAIVVAVSGATAAAAPGPSISAGRGCYVVGKAVPLSGSGFASRREYVVSVDGVYFGQSKTRANGTFSSSLRPGGLGAGAAQQVEQLEVTDGTLVANASFTLTRATGARFLATSGRAGALRAPFEAWDLSPTGAQRMAYLHYVNPDGGLRETVALGTTTGQCGYLKTAKRKVFPFAPYPGTWTFQIDTRKAYSPHAGGSVARIRVGVA